MPSQVERDAKIVGTTIAGVLPQTNKYWFQQPHLLRLNLLLIIPLLSSSVSGYDGQFSPCVNSPRIYSHPLCRFLDERTSIARPMARVL